MKPRQKVTVSGFGDLSENRTVLAAVTNVNLHEGALVISYDGDNGPEQVIFAPGCWSRVKAEMEPDPHG